jgi:hypothetical protein
MNMAKNKAAENKATNKAAENKAAENNVYEMTAEEKALEAALLALLAIGRADLIEPAIKAANMAATDAEHAAARPQTAEEKALAALQAIGLDMAALEPVQATAANLAMSLDALAKAAGKYGRYAIVFDADNGTSCVSHYMLKTLAESGRVTLADTLAFARKTLPSYSSAGHYNTMKRLFKAAGYRVNVSQGSFSLSV